MVRSLTTWVSFMIHGLLTQSGQNANQKTAQFLSDLDQARRDIKQFPAMSENDKIRSLDIVLSRMEMARCEAKSLH
jgi:hypothetical protein